jgi:hypothetical protein
MGTVVALAGQVGGAEFARDIREIRALEIGS